ncbi:hypothetical protein BKA62DRAFT_512550 [Auriculariales sp. MPI-PUGE-AT-0066]|nr:hypothetical protein BKA62DRAFT_512550 [Auriculariales sp. MPI-PUGE-AT-0066]
MIQHKLLYCVCTILPPPLSRARPLVPFERRQCCPSFARFSTWLAPTHPPTHAARRSHAVLLPLVLSLPTLSVFFLYDRCPFSFSFFVYRTHLFCICLLVVCPFLFWRNLFAFPLFFAGRPPSLWSLVILSLLVRQSLSSAQCPHALAGAFCLLPTRRSSNVAVRFFLSSLTVLGVFNPLGVKPEA